MNPTCEVVLEIACRAAKNRRRQVRIPLTGSLHDGGKRCLHALAIDTHTRISPHDTPLRIRERGEC